MQALNLDLSDILGDVVPQITTNFEAALDLARRGLNVFPITLKEHGGWTPILGWQEAATCDLAKVRAWWQREYPGARVGLPTGKKNGIVALDIDRKNGKDGFAALRALGFDSDALSPVTTRTPSGGAHLFFAYSDGLKNSVSKIATGLDVRSEGGFVVAPGSFKDGTRYDPIGATLGEADLPAFPDTLRPVAERERDPVDVIKTASEQQRAWAESHLAKLVDDLGEMGDGDGRNTTLNDAAMWAGGAAAHGMIDRESASAALWAACERNGLRRREFESTFESGWEAGLRKPIGDFPREVLADDFDDLPDDPNNLSDILGDDRKPESYALDEDGVIRAFTTRHKGELLFDHHAGRWFRFDGNVWRREETKLAHHYARALSTKFAKADPKAKALNRVSTWEAIERGARTVREFACTSDIWNRDHWLLGTPGGTVDLRTGRLRPGRPDDRISRLTAAAPVDLASFDPTRHCPLWMSFLDQALGGDAAAIRFLQQWGGYSLTGDTREQVLLFVYGPGGSGKGTAINTIGDVLSEYAVNIAMETLTAAKHDRHPTEIARLHGARMARASETEKGRAWAENRIKTLTGQDTVTARFMRQDDFEFMPEFKLTIFGNNRPSLRDVDAAIRRRFMVLPFDHPPAKKDVTLPERLRGEWSGILSWLIQGCLDWQRNGLVRPAIVDRATDDYFAEQDTFGQWVAECCETGPRVADSASSLWDSWRMYAASNSEDPGSKKRTFPETLQQRGFEKLDGEHGIRGKGYRGIRVIERDPFTEA
ncbi:phage/plasmid primase, P4 family [Mesorhizobium sp. M1142]|uniref:phage/plasmid primase, P4 family n=1 Tax=Mesorhizobium sp. M1142 TaxID=2957060 RepID=UPI0033375029